LAIDLKELLYESPCWDDIRVCTWFIDVYRGKLLKLKNGCVNEFYTFNFLLTSVNLCESNRLILTSRDEIFLFNPETHEIQLLHKFIFKDKFMRLNDCKVSYKGELIFSYFEDNSPRNQKGSVGIFGMRDLSRILYENLFFTPNGIVHDGLNEILWLADTSRGLIYQVDSKRPVSKNTYFGSEVIKVIKVDSSKGRPDGGNLDANGNYWVALHGGARVGAWNLSGEMIAEILLSKARPTMVCFGGINLDRMDISFKFTGDDNSMSESILSKPSETIGRMTYKFLDC
jgi:sugar lactone lactonase YvrE